MVPRLILLAIVFAAGCDSGATTPRQPPSESARDVQSDSVTAPAPDVENPTDAAPVTAGAIVYPATATPGDRVTLAIRVKMAPGWHIYGLSGGPGPSQPTQIELELPDSVIPDGDWAARAPLSQVTSLGIASVYHDEVTFRRQLRVADSAAPASVKLVCQVHYQACDARRCLPPVSIPLTSQLAITGKE